ncbi:hypothetical protein SDC9_122557 [bioreactor metagenome]|uniref:Flagellar assembly protein FliH/Type III secretion system HrpE domain-containing protein n=1 Tax=bioreactor metagenome TaxID=1076179 RepID=A0A645CF87_9ZZZZ
MRSLPKIIKEGDVILTNHCVMVGGAANGKKPYAAPEIKTYFREEEMINQARMEAHRITERAEAAAVKILQKASVKAQEELERAYQTGLDNGLNDGRKKAKEELRFSIGEVVRLVSSIEEGKKTIFARYEKDLKNLTVDIAEEIINEKLQQDNRLFLNIYQKAVCQYNEQDWIKLTVSGFEEEFVTSNAELLLSMTKDATDLKIAVLKEAPRGTCIVETPESVTDSGVSTQLKIVREAFQNADIPQDEIG